MSVFVCERAKREKKRERERVRKRLGVWVLASSSPVQRRIQMLYKCDVFLMVHA